MLRKLYRKHAKANSEESQQAMAFLKAGKLEGNSDSSQNLKSWWTLESYTTCTEDFCQT